MATVKRVAGFVAQWGVKARSFSAAPASEAALKEPTLRVTLSSAAPAAQDAKPASLKELSNAQVVHLLKAGLVSPHRLEADLDDATRAVDVRRAFIVESLSKASGSSRTSINPKDAMSHLPSGAFNVDSFYKSILNTNCEAVIGYVPLPVGIVGPLLLDSRPYYVPMATTEGALLASTNRGCAAIRRAGGATSVVLANGMTRAPLVRLESLAEAAQMKAWLEVPSNYALIAAAFNSTTRFGRLQSVSVATAGRNVYLRFKAGTGDAMGMNMITKGVNEALTLLHTQFPNMRVLSLSGNMCTDKKPSAINWIEGRGKSVAAEVRLSGHVLKSVLKTSADAMVELNTAKNLVGSALAGSIGGFNAHAANIVSAVFLATGQDPAQNVESSTCLTLMEKDDRIVDPADPEGKAGAGIVMTVTMPSVEVGTVGGGTSLPAQAACLELMGLKGSSVEHPGSHAEQLARVVAGSVLAGELSLMSALTTNDLLSSHMKLNRKHGGDASAGGVLSVSEAMLTKLRELNGHANVAAAAAHPEGGAHAGVTYTTVFTPANASASDDSSVSTETARSSVHAAPSGMTLAGSVPGGAPAGSHPHPLHVGGHSSTTGFVAPTTSHPGRRYFAAPSSRVSRFGGHPGVSSTMGNGWAAETAAPTNFFAARVGGKAAVGVDEETRSTPASRYGWEEPMLSVP